MYISQLGADHEHILIKFSARFNELRPVNLMMSTRIVYICQHSSFRLSRRLFPKIYCELWLHMRNLSHSYWVMFQRTELTGGLCAYRFNKIIYVRRYSCKLTPFVLKPATLQSASNQPPSMRCVVPLANWSDGCKDHVSYLQSARDNPANTDSFSSRESACIPLVMNFYLTLSKSLSHPSRRFRSSC